jgi:hypothetical protein
VVQDWTVDDMDGLLLHVLGRPDNELDVLYIALEDSVGRIAVLAHPEPNIILHYEWAEWAVVFSEFADVNPAGITSLHIGVGDRFSPQPGGSGTICIDDIMLTKGTP